MNALIPIEWAAKCLARLIEQVDSETGDLDDALIQAFGDAKGDLVSAVTKRQAIASQLRATLEGVRTYRAEVDAYIQRLKRLEEKLKADALKAVEALPGVDIRGATGKKLYSRGSQSLKLSFDFKESRTISNVISIEDIEFLGIDDRYIKTVTAFVLDTVKVKEDLKAGARLSWATLEESQHVCGLFPSPKELENERG